jgi:anti-sigma factor RsiW
MVKRDPITNEKIQDYVDGRLEGDDRAAVAAYLLTHPDVAFEVEALRQQNETLKVLGQDILEEPVPARLREVLQKPAVVDLEERRRPRRAGFLEAAAAILVFCAGGAVGWFLHETLDPGLQADDLIAADVASMYRFYGAERDYPPDFPADQSAELASWISRTFDRDMPPPDLAPLGYQYRGGSLLPTTGAPTGFFQFEGPESARLAVFFWLAERPPEQIADIGTQNNVSARYWFGDGFSFAVMGDQADPNLDQVADAVFQFYQQLLAAP